MDYLTVDLLSEKTRNLIQLAVPLKLESIRLKAVGRPFVASGVISEI